MTNVAKKTAARTSYRKTSLDAKIAVLAGAENPRRPGTAAHRRAAAVLRCAAAGKTVADALRAGAKSSTVRHMAEAKLIRVSAPSKKAA